MKAPKSLLFGSLLLFSALAGAEEVELTEDPEAATKCEGMYSRRAWGGLLEPFILTKFRSYKPTGDDDPNVHPIVAIAIFEWADFQYLGVDQPREDGLYKKLLCDQEAIDSNFCTADKYGTFIINDDSNQRANDIITQSVDLRNETLPTAKYLIVKTGYYCIMTARMADTYSYSAVAEFRNSYGELPGGQIAKLPFYGGLAIVYAVIGIFWGFLYAQNRSDILPVQNYITAMLGFLVAEMVLTWGYYDYRNRHGTDVGSKVFMLVVSVLNAARNSLSFFLLLIVCMGYGVVKPSLGKTMIWVRWLAIAHLLFGVIYAIGSLTVKPEDASILILLVVLPLAATGTAFYVWTLNSLGATMKDLAERKQRTKAAMYRKLWWCILGSVFVIFAFFFLNVVIFTGSSTDEYRTIHWQSRWFVLDGWLGIVYLADVAFIAYLWRPTANNRRFAMSDELSQDDEGFEIASLRDSLDDDERGDLAEAGLRSATAGSGRAEVKRASSPLPAPTPQRPMPALSRDSLDGETIFAVGEEDRLSDEDADDEERKGLTKKD